MESILSKRSINHAQKVLQVVLDKKQADCLEDTLSAIRSCVNKLVEAEPIFKRPNLTNNLRSADVQTRCRGTHILILGACLDLLEAGWQLLVMGYPNRVLSCVRDTYEGLQFADWCLSNEQVASNWLNGIKVRQPRHYQCPQEIVTDSQTDKILNIWGTHLGYEATMSVWHARATMSPAYIKDEEQLQFHKFFVLRDFATLLQISAKGLAYILKRHSDLVDSLPGVDEQLRVAASTGNKVISTVVEMYQGLTGHSL